MRFLVDHCAGRLLANWLRGRGYDVVEARELGTDPGDGMLLERAATEGRILVTIDTDFGELVYAKHAPHAGLVRLVIERHRPALETRAVVTVRGERVRISRHLPLP